MALKINKLLTPYNHSSGNIGRIKYLVIHYVGALGDAKNNCQYYASGYIGASAHYYVGFNGDIWQSVEDKNIAWSVGAPSYKHPYCRNSNSLNIEMCVRKKSTKTMNATDKDWYFEDATYKNAVLLAAELLTKYNIPFNNMIRHYDVTGKWCPAPFCENNTKYTWESFKADVKKVLNGKEIVVEDPQIYRIRLTWKNEKSQLGAYEVLQNAKNACPAGYKVFDKDGKVVFENKNKTATGGKTQWTEFKGLTEKQAAEKILLLAKADSERSGILPSVTAAQMILESGYVTTELSKYNNCFGMKTMLSGNTWANSTWDGVSKVNIRTPEEYTKGVITYIYADFRKYPCIEDSVGDHSAYLLGAKNGSALRYAGLTKCKNYREAITLIKKGEYATDSQYVDKICNIIERYNLARYDNAMANTVAPSQTSEKPPQIDSKPVSKEIPTNASKVEYRVQCGSYSDINNARRMVALMKSKKFDASLENYGTWIAQAGRFFDKSRADALAKKLDDADLPWAVIEM